MIINEILTWMLDVVSSVDPVLRTAIAGVGIFLETSVLVGLIVPGDTIVIVAATAVDSPVGFAALVATVIVGALGGESVGFALGRFFGPRIRVSRLGRRIGEHNWRRAENYVDRRGGPAVFISRFLPVLHSLVPLTVGMSRMSYRRFLAWTVPACVVWSLLYVGFGSLVAGGYRQIASQAHFAGYLFVAAIAVFWVLVIVVKKLLERAERRHWERPGDPSTGSGRRPSTGSGRPADATTVEND